MKRGYEERVSPDVYIFEEGDLVWIRQRRQGKSLPKATGPYTFVRYWGKN